MRKLSEINFQVKDTLLLTLILVPFYFLSTIYFYTSPDEYYYIFTAIQIAEGKNITIHFESPLISLDFVPTIYPNTYILSRPIGQSLLISVFYLVGGYYFIYYVNAVFAILTVILSYFCALEISKDRVCSLFGALLLGICPPMIFGSRNLMSDLPSMTFLLLSFFFYIKAVRKNKYLFYLISSSSLVFAIFIRYPNILFVIPILLNQIRSKKFRELSTYIYYIPLILSICVIGLYNLHFFGNVLTTGFHITGTVYKFNFYNLVFHLPKYFLIYNLFPPLGLVASFLYIRKKMSIDKYFINLFVILTFLIFYSCFYYLPFDIEHLFVDSTRHLLIILPYLSINTVNWFKERIKPQKFFVAFIILFVIFGTLNIGIIWQYNAFKGRLLYYRDIFYENTEPESLIIGDDTWDKLFHPYFSRTYGERYYLRYSSLSKIEIVDELLPFVENWIKDKPVYFIDDPYVEINIHDFILQVLTERYHLHSVITTDHPYTVELFSINRLVN